MTITGAAPYSCSIRRSSVKAQFMLVESWYIFSWVRMLLSGARTHRSLNRLLTSTPATGTDVFIYRESLLSSQRKSHLSGRRTGAFEMRVSDGAAPIQLKSLILREMNGRSTLRAVPREAQQAVLPLPFSLFLDSITAFLCLQPCRFFRVSSVSLTVFQYTSKPANTCQAPK